MKKTISMTMMVLAAVCAAYGETYERGKVYGPIAELGGEARTINGNGAIIDGGGTARCATLGPNVTLKNFTFRNGKAAVGGGVWGGTVENCTIKGCTATEYGAAVANCKVVATTITACTLPLSSSKVAIHGGIVAASTLDGVTITGCRVEIGMSVPCFGGIAANSSLDDCAVTDNDLVISGDHYGLLFYGGSLSKSTIQGNSVDSSLANVAAYMKVTPSGCALDGDAPLPPPGTKKLTVKSNGTKYGTVSGSGYYVEGKVVTLKATAKSGYVFTGWFTDKDFKKKLVLDVEGYDYRQPKVKYVMPAKKVTVYAKFNSVSYDKKYLKFSSETAKLAKSAKTYTAGEAMSLKLGFTAKSLPAVTVSKKEPLPNGMKIDPLTGKITGTPSKPGSYTAKVTVKTAAGNKISQDVKIKVKVPSGYYGTFYGCAIVKTTPAYVKFTSDEYGKVSGKVTYKGKGYSFTAKYSSSAATKSAFTPSIKIGSTTYKPKIAITREKDGGLTISEAHGEVKNFVLGAQKKLGKIKKGKSLEGLIGTTVTLKNSKYPDAQLPKSSDKLTLKFAATDAVQASGKLNGRSVSFSTAALVRSKEKTESGTVYTIEVALIEPTSKYYRLVTCTVTVGEKTKITKKEFGEIQ